MISPVLDTLTIFVLEKFIFSSNSLPFSINSLISYSNSFFESLRITVSSAYIILLIVCPPIFVPLFFLKFVKASSK